MLVSPSVISPEAVGVLVTDVGVLVDGTGVFVGCNGVFSDVGVKVGVLKGCPLMF